jgi:RHS repeat-associated protein
VDPWNYTDYDGVMPYADSTVADDEGTAAFTQLSRYQGGAGILARQTIDQGQVDTTTHLHGDLIRSTNLTTDDAGDGVSAVAYTAFGEVLGASGPGSPAPAGFPRYGYAGGWGYESDLLTLEGHDTNLPPITLQHVGARWYDPSIGRFVMRDPIGIDGGLNVYAYVGNRPAFRTDPSGLDWIQDLDNFLDRLITAEPLADTSAAVGVGHAANFKWKLSIGKPLNRGGMVCVGIYLGWRVGKLIVNNTSVDEALGKGIYDDFINRDPKWNTVKGYCPDNIH